MFVVVKTTGVPPALTGYLSRYLLELESGLYVGKTSRRLAEFLWNQVRRYAGDGHALAVLSDGSELGFELRTHNHPRLTERDFDGIVLPVLRVEGS